MGKVEGGLRPIQGRMSGPLSGAPDTDYLLAPPAVSARTL